MISRGVLGGVYNVFKANNYCFLTEQISNVDHNYYQCIPKRRRRSDFKAEMYSWFIQMRGDTIRSGWSQFVLSENSNYLLWKHYKPLPTHLSISLGYIAISCKHILLSNTLNFCFLCYIDNKINRYIGVEKMIIVCMNQEYISALKSERLPLFGIHW
jgi:hypothetical protein